MIAKSIYLTVLFVAIVGFAASKSAPELEGNFVIPANNASHNLIVGRRTGVDHLLFQKTVVKPSAWLRIVTHEETFTLGVFDRITKLQVLDQEIDGNGARPCLLGGGPGFNYATLRFESKRSYGINFVVEIYAEY